MYLVCILTVSLGFMFPTLGFVGSREAQIGEPKAVAVSGCSIFPSPCSVSISNTDDSINLIINYQYSVSFFSISLALILFILPILVLILPPLPLPPIAYDIGTGSYPAR